MTLLTLSWRDISLPLEYLHARHYSTVQAETGAAQKGAQFTWVFRLASLGTIWAVSRDIRIYIGLRQMWQRQVQEKPISFSKRRTCQGHKITGDMMQGCMQ